MDPIRIMIAIGLVLYGLYSASFLIAMAMPPVVTTLLITFIFKTVLAIAAAVAVWRGLSWDSLAVVVLGIVVAATWLFEGFVLGIVAYLYALFAAVIALAITLAIAAYLNGWFGFRVYVDSRSRPRPLS
jgi:hypothetical protein